MKDICGLCLVDKLPFPTPGWHDFQKRWLFVLPSAKTIQTTQLQPVSADLIWTGQGSTFWIPDRQMWVLMLRTTVYVWQWKLVTWGRGPGSRDGGSTGMSLMLPAWSCFTRSFRSLRQLKARQNGMQVESGWRGPSCASVTLVAVRAAGHLLIWL